MEQPELRVFFEKAESQLAGIRGGLLLAAQNGFSARDIEFAAKRLDAIEADAAARGLQNVTGFSARLRGLAEIGKTDANSALDIVAGVESALLQFALQSEDFLADVNSLVETSFNQLGGDVATPEHGVTDEADEWTDFEIDEETFEIFQSEADGLIANITANLQFLGSSPEDTSALWEIRRNAHTFKGAAGIIGLKAASALAHRIEDLLDKMVESRRPADSRVVDLLAIAADHLGKMASGTHADDKIIMEALAADFDAVLASPSAKRPKNVAAPLANKTAISGHAPAPHHNAPIVRVSLDRLDELLRISRLLVNSAETDGGSHLELAHDISQKLLQLRMVRFGTLETRLKRAVHVTCQEEGKKADLIIDGADVEIDTQTIDAVIEPLLHLLKNAVVHGIEAPETRRLLAKSEKGRISIIASADRANVVLIVEDDGCGISTEKLVKKALINGILTAGDAQAMSEDEATELIFHRGLTTAESLSMNAGRGVGMSIVRQSVESCGGKLAVASEPQKGAAFTITVPVVVPVSPDELPDAGLAQPSNVPLVLVVDDSSSIRRQMAKFVEDAGLRAITAVDGADALELMLNGRHEPDLILSDVEMPNMNGWEFLEYVKTDENFGHVPVVMVTSLDGDQYRQMASRLGASDYIVKPFGAKDLENVLAKFCAVAVG